jgi:TetR/AcrR family transcriptional regulator of autoinduction and epiphytic fitness
MREAQARGVATTDGRLARSLTTRAAVVDALLALIEDGDLRPTAPRIAARAGVSLRSVFQHFRDLEALFAAAADRQTQRLRPLIDSIAPDAPLAERLATFVAHRTRLLEALSPVRRAALLMEPFSNEVAKRLRAVRALKRAEIECVFAAELAACPPAERRDRLAALDVTGSYSTWHALRVHQDLPVERARKVLTYMLTALLAGASAPDRRKHGHHTHAG